MENGNILQNLEIKNRKQDFIMIGKNEENTKKMEQNAIKMLKIMCICCSFY